MGDPLGLRFCGQPLLACPSGALFWPARKLLAVADLHLEKASALAARGALLPPYDSRATLDKLAAAIARFEPEIVVCLGDSLHDRHAGDRWTEGEAHMLAALIAPRRWIWVLGNHDPELPAGLSGERHTVWTFGGLTFRHEAEPGARAELSGHYHPKCRVPGRAGARACFLIGSDKLILPAFGAFTGGLAASDPALAGLMRGSVLALARGRTSLLPVKLA
ncbi:MAG: ligase-associated DNA damage response endonuclease PdeM [Rhodothalassiaceae bacterium]